MANLRYGAVADRNRQWDLKAGSHFIHFAIYAFLCGLGSDCITGFSCWVQLTNYYETVWTLEVPSEVALSFSIGILRELRKAVKSETTVGLFCSCNFCNTCYFLIFSRGLRRATALGPRRPLHQWPTVKSAPFTLVISKTNSQINSPRLSEQRRLVSTKFILSETWDAGRKLSFVCNLFRYEWMNEWMNEWMILFPCDKKSSWKPV